MSDNEVKTDFYDNILEDYTPGEMHINDRKYIKLLLSKQDLRLEEYLIAQEERLCEKIQDKVSAELAKVITESNTRMFETLERQNEQIALIKDMIEEIKKENAIMKNDFACHQRGVEERMRIIEEYASKRNTLIRMAIVFLASLLAFLGIHKLWL